MNYQDGKGEFTVIVKPKIKYTLGGMEYNYIPEVANG